MKGDLNNTQNKNMIKIYRHIEHKNEVSSFQSLYFPPILVWVFLSMTTSK